MTKRKILPPSPYPIGSDTNCKTAGWNDYFCGIKRDECPFPKARLDLHKGWREGWDAAKASGLS